MDVEALQNSRLVQPASSEGSEAMDWTEPSCLRGSWPPFCLGAAPRLASVAKFQGKSRRLLLQKHDTNQRLITQRCSCGKVLDGSPASRAKFENATLRGGVFRLDTAQPSGRSVEGLWPPQQIALCQFDAQIAQHGELLLRFDALGKRLASDRPRELNQGGGQCALITA